MALCALTLASCGGTKKSASDFKDVKLSKESSINDSLGYLVGQMYGLNTVGQQLGDTTLSKEDREAFNEGFYAGLGLATDNDQYNMGLLAGLSAAKTAFGWNKDLGTKVEADAIASGYKKGLETKGEGAAVQSAMQQVDSKVSASLQNMMQKKAKEAKDAYLKDKKDVKKAGENYYNVKKAGNGQKLELGNTANVKMSLKDEKGNELMQGMGDQVQPMPVGGTGTPAIDTILPQLKVGDQIEIVATAYDIYGDRTPGNLKPTDIVLIGLEIVPEGAAEAPAAAAAPAAAPAPAPAK